MRHSLLYCVLLACSVTYDLARLACLARLTLCFGGGADGVGIAVPDRHREPICVCRQYLQVEARGGIMSMHLCLRLTCDCVHSDLDRKQLLVASKWVVNE